VLKSATKAVKVLKSPLARQTVHFGLNGVKAISGQAMGIGCRSVLERNLDPIRYASPASIASTFIAGGAGGTLVQSREKKWEYRKQVVSY